MEIYDLLHDLCMIEAFSHHEEKRSLFCVNWFKENGIDAFIDEVGNVIVPFHMGDKKIPVFMAHLDTVFSSINQEYIDDGERIYYPGVGDDTANVVILMLVIREIINKNIPGSALFVLNVCEEGLGNLKGSKAIFKRYENKISMMVSFDCGLDSIVNEAVGSKRYRLTIKTEGGHSYSNFGNRNAINEMARIVSEIYSIKPSLGTTYNVGVIEGGNSINSISEECSILYETRSNNQQAIENINNIVNSIIEKCPCEKKIELLGERPGMGNVSLLELKELTERARICIFKHTKKEPVICAGSTDCNIPLSLGIPAICFGGIIGGLEHTKEEWIDKKSILVGYDTILDFVITEINRFS